MARTAPRWRAHSSPSLFVHPEVLVPVTVIGAVVHDFNEVVFDDAFVPDDYVMGEIDGAWKQATSELAYERSGPERFLETFYVMLELIRALGPEPDMRSAEGLGRLVAQLHALRRMTNLLYFKDVIAAPRQEAKR